MTESMLASQIEEYSRAHGFLVLRLYVIFTTPVNGLDPVQAVSKEHLAHQIALERKGLLFAAGPILTEDGLHCEGEGMIVVRAATLEEARQIAEQDPMHRSGARRYRIRPWVMNEGSLNVTVRFSDSSVVVG